MVTNHVHVYKIAQSKIIHEYSGKTEICC